MKAKRFLLQILGCIFLGFSFFSCSNDFLQGEKNLEAQVTDTIRMTDFETELPVVFNLPEAANGHWRVFQFPAWLKVTPMEGHFTNGKATFQLELPDKTYIPQWGLLELPLIFDVEGIGLVQYPFQFFNFGNPQSGLSTYDLMLSYQSAGSVTIQNNGGGILLWEVKDKPSWISVSKSTGSLNPNYAEQLKLTISRDGMAKGDYSGQITIATNSIQQNLTLKISIKVSDPTMSGNAEFIEGDIVDVHFCKATGQLAIATKNPNRMYLYRSGQPRKTLELQKIPINVAITEKGDQIAATFTNTDLSIISPESFTIQKNIQTGIITSDLALGDNGWAYLAPKAYDTNYLLSVDLNSGQIVKNSEYMNGLTWLKKVPGKNLLYGSKIGWSPDFLLVFNIADGAASPVADQYWVSLWKFWTSEDGQRIFTGSRKIYESPDFLMKGSIMETPRMLGEIEPVSGTINSMEHSLVLKELLVAFKSYSYETGTKILRIDDSGYFIKNTFAVNNIPIEENGNFFSVIPEIPYMFVGKTGQDLYLIKQAMGNSGKNYWYYEKISL